ncbi:conserved domain protein [Clostridium sp. CAG:169]|nr:conserved domain protein [Clostridium sp. CAG:169]
MDYLDADLRVAQFFQRLFDRLYRALYVCFDNQRQLFGLSDLDLLEQVIQRYLLVGAELLLLGLLSALFNQLTSQSFVLNGIELVACCRYLCQTGDFDRSGRTCGFDALAAGVGHHSDSADCGACNDTVAGFEGTVLHQDGSDRTSALIEFCFDDSTLCQTVRVCFQLFYLSHQQDVFQQVLNAHLGLCRNRNTDDVAAPFLRYQLVLGQLLHNLIRVCSRFIHFVDSNDDRNASRFCVVDRLNGLRHDAVVGSYNQHCNIGDVRTARTHSGKRLMSRGIQEGDWLAADVDLVRTDVLGDTACLGGGDIRMTNGVKDGGLTVVYVTHNNNDRRTLYLLFVLILAVVEQTVLDGNDHLTLDLCTDFHCNQCSGIVVDDVRHRLHLAQCHQAFDNLCRLNFQLESQVADGDFIRQGDVQLLTALALHLQLLEFLHLLVLFGHEVLFLIVSAADLLFLHAVVAFCQIGRCNIFITLVVFVQLDVCRTHIHVTDHLTIDVFVQFRVDGRCLSWRSCRFLRFCRFVLLWTIVVIVHAAVAVVRTKITLWAVIRAETALRTVAAVAGAESTLRAVAALAGTEATLWAVAAGSAFAGAIIILRTSFTAVTVGTVVLWAVGLRLLRGFAAFFRARALWCFTHILLLPLHLSLLGIRFLLSRCRLWLFLFCRFWLRFYFWLCRLGFCSLLDLRQFFFCRAFSHSFRRFFLRLWLCLFLLLFFLFLFRFGLCLRHLGFLAVRIIAVQAVHLIFLRIGFKNKIQLFIAKGGGALFFTRELLFQQLHQFLHRDVQVLCDLADSVFIIYHANIRLLLSRNAFVLPVLCC